MQALTHTKNTHVINAASLRSEVFEMFTRKANTTLNSTALSNLEKGLEQSEYTLLLIGGIL